MKNWEQGSDFHYISEYFGHSAAPWGERGQFYFSGRPALNALVEWLRAQGQAQRIWIPAYYCDQVVYPLLDKNFLCLYYDGNPQTGWDIQPKLFQAGDILLANSFFGIDLLSISVMEEMRKRGVLIVEDHSQDPYSELAWVSKADYSFASLRKTLPLPDGGVLWSPACLPLPPASEFIPEVSTERVAAMLAKRTFLQGAFDDKMLFRRWYSESESELDQQMVSGMSEYSRAALHSFDVDRWRKVRAKNHKILCTSVVNRSLTLLYSDKSHLSPMGLVILLENTIHRDGLKKFLIDLQIYPAILWPLVKDMPVNLSVKAHSFSQQMLFIHCDGRYNADDMLRVAQALNRFAPGLEVPQLIQKQQKI